MNGKNLAFPHSFEKTTFKNGEYKFDENSKHISEGISVRELFAAMAMQGMLAHDRTGSETNQMIAKSAVNMADALIEELSKEK